MENSAANVETNLYLSSGEKFVSPMSYEDTLAKIKEGNGKITLIRYAVLTRIITDQDGNQSEVLANSKITTRIDTTLSPIAVYEEIDSTDIKRTNETK